MKKFILLLIILTIGINACEKGKPVKPASVGKINQLLVVIPDADWKGATGDTIRKYFAREVDVLPQSEPLFSIYQIDPSIFDKNFFIQRNVLVFKKGQPAGVFYAHDEFAEPQLVVTVRGNGPQDWQKLLAKHAEQMIDSFKTMEKRLILSAYKKNDFINTDSIKKYLHIDIKIPKTYKKIVAKNGFFWYRHDLRDGSKNILLYSVPLENLDSLAAKIPQIRDSIGKKYIPGPLPNTWMITEQGFSPVQKKLKIAGVEAVESRGLWEVKNDFMGGPYLNYIIPDKKHNRAVIIEGFIYLPADFKRNMLTELEAILQTARLTD